MYINWLELMAPMFPLFKLGSPGDIVQLYLNNMMAIAFIRQIREPAPHHYAKKASCYGIKPSRESSQSSLLSGEDFKLASTEF